MGMLLQSGANLEARDQNGCTPLMFSVANGDEAVTRSLLVSQANVSVKDFEGQMPLDYALNFGHERLVKMLRSAGGQASQPDWSEPHAKASADVSGMPNVDPATSCVDTCTPSECSETMETASVDGSEGKPKK